ncbi:uncharacterized protein LOC120197637 [Hibiscus syriacus]|uniref:uncharacterized protein LOC120197637 n=1 Tax=Hibiscus syriacus TaxID=106335 RepID=UPI001921B067|nr:uncharacterized protein LOC120197637 [Hibiscus syriacus]
MDLQGFRDDYPISVDQWLRKILCTLCQLHLTPNGKQECVIALLKGDVIDWWEILELANEPEKPTSEYFISEFCEKYIGEVHTDDLRDQFLHLKQGNRIVLEYEKEFLRLSKFEPKLNLTEANNYRRFRDSLHSDIQTQLTTNQLRVFVDLTCQAMAVERILNNGS